MTYRTAKQFADAAHRKKSALGRWQNERAVTCPDHRTKRQEIDGATVCGCASPFSPMPLEKTVTTHDDALKQLSHIAHARAFGRHVGSDRLVHAGLDALIAGVESPSLAMLAGLLRSEEPEAPALFDQVLEELGLLFHAPADHRAAKWAMAHRVAGQIADGSMDPAAGTHLIRADISYDLGYPKEREPLVHCAHNLDGWEESWEVSFEELNREAVEAAKQFQTNRVGSRGGG
jgi:hypothetical protein